MDIFQIPRNLLFENRRILAEFDVRVDENCHKGSRKDAEDIFAAKQLREPAEF